MQPFHPRYRFGAASAALRLAYLRVAVVAFVIAQAVLWFSPAQATSPRAKPTVVLVHGAFADASSWNGVITRLLADGYPVIAVANPLRGVRSDAQVVAGVTDSVQGNVVLVGHSYGGNVITNAATGKANVKALVYVAAFAPDVGESVSGLAGKFPGSTLGTTLAPAIPLADGNKDLYIMQSQFHAQFAADLPVAVSDLMGVGQRPITEAALNEPSGEPAWRSIPSWFIYGTWDKNIPPALQPFMARRAGAKDVVQIFGASHVLMTSHPIAVAKLIEQAATATSD